MSVRVEEQQRSFPSAIRLPEKMILGLHNDNFFAHTSLAALQKPQLDPRTSDTQADLGGESTPLSCIPVLVMYIHTLM